MLVGGPAPNRQALLKVSLAGLLVTLPSSNQPETIEPKGDSSRAAQFSSDRQAFLLQRSCPNIIALLLKQVPQFVKRSCDGVTIAEQPANSQALFIEGASGVIVALLLGNQSHRGEQIGNL